MKVSELISRLERFMYENGDLRVVTVCDYCEYVDPCDPYIGPTNLYETDTQVCISDYKDWLERELEIEIADSELERVCVIQ